MNLPQEVEQRKQHPPKRSGTRCVDIVSNMTFNAYFVHPAKRLLRPPLPVMNVSTPKQPRGARGRGVLGRAQRSRHGVRADSIR